MNQNGCFLKRKMYSLERMSKQNDMAFRGMNISWTKGFLYGPRNKRPCHDVQIKLLVRSLFSFVMAANTCRLDVHGNNNAHSFHYVGI